MKEGFIMLGRDLQDSPLFNEKRVFSKFEAWIDILYEVNYRDGSSLIGSTIIECKKGQSIMSLESWAKRWHWNKSAVRRFFDLLKICNMIEIENMVKTTRITVLLSNSYDDSRNASETQVKRIWNASETHLTPIEESNKVIKKESNKKEVKTKNVFTPPTILQTETIFLERKEKEKEKSSAKKEKEILPSQAEFMEYAKIVIENELKKPFENYQFVVLSKFETWLSDGWKDGNGKKILNWKSKFKNTLPYLKPLSNAHSVINSAKTASPGSATDSIFNGKEGKPMLRIIHHSKLPDCSNEGQQFKS